MMTAEYCSTWDLFALLPLNFAVSVLSYEMLFSPHTQQAQAARENLLHRGTLLLAFLKVKILIKLYDSVRTYGYVVITRRRWETCDKANRPS